jgi:hypothetical protein
MLASSDGQNRIHVYMNCFDHKDLGNHPLQLCPKVVKHPVYPNASMHDARKKLGECCPFACHFQLGEGRVTSRQLLEHSL